MNERLQDEQYKLITWSVVVLAGAAIAMILYLTRDVMVPFVLALLISTLISPVVDIQVTRWKLPHWAAVTVAMFLLLAIIAVIAVIMITAIQSVAASANQYSQDLINISDEIVARLEVAGIKIDEEGIAREVKSKLPTIATSTIGSVTHWITGGALVLIFSVFLLAGRKTVKPNEGIYREIDLKVRKYLTIKIGISLVTGLAVWGLLWILGLRFAFVFGVMTFFLNFIPSVGSIFAVMLPIPVAISQSSDIGWILLVILLPGSIQVTMGNLIEPKLQGVGLTLHPVVILLALALWGLLWGIPGMVLAVPLTAILRIVLLQFETTKPVGDALAGDLPAVHPKAE